MDKLISIDDERLWNILYEEACVEGQQADRIYKALEDIAKSAAFDKEKVIEELDKCKQIMLSPASKDCFGEECRENDCMACVFNKAIEIVEKGGM